MIVVFIRKNLRKNIIKFIFSNLVRNKVTNHVHNKKINFSLSQSSFFFNSITLYESSFLNRPVVSDEIFLEKNDGTSGDITIASAAVTALRQRNQDQVQKSMLRSKMF